MSCDHLRECLNELLGVGPTTSLRGLLSARHLVWECGPNRNNRRTETRARGTKRNDPLSLSLSGHAGMRLESTYLPVGLLLNPRSRLMDSSSPAPMHATYLRHALTTTCTRVDVPLEMSSLLTDLFFSFAPSLRSDPTLNATEPTLDLRASPSDRGRSRSTRRSLEIVSSFQHGCLGTLNLLSKDIKWIERGNRESIDFHLEMYRFHSIEDTRTKDRIYRLGDSSTIFCRSICTRIVDTDLEER